jgi:hypothetical protein
MREFINNHLRLVTFLITLAIILALFIPIAYYESKEYFSDRGDTRPEMTTGDLILLADDGQKGTLKPADFTKYKCVERETNEDKYVDYIIEIDDTYRVMVGFNTETGEMLFFVMSDSETHAKIDILNGGDLRAYFANKK